MVRASVALARRLADLSPCLAVPCSRASASASSKERLARARDSVTRFDTLVPRLPDGSCPSGSSRKDVCCDSLTVMGYDLLRACRLRGTRRAAKRREAGCRELAKAGGHGLAKAE